MTPERLQKLERTALEMTYVIPSSVPPFLREAILINKLGQEILDVLSELERVKKVVTSMIEDMD